jgi:3-hydroxyacyl-CoA dehydrogenase/3-hydroxy-2-methylbutyryl-CoA dehydrogenase
MSLDMLDFTLKVNTLGTFNVSKQVAQVIAKQDPFTEDGMWMFEMGKCLRTSYN